MTSAMKKWLAPQHWKRDSDGPCVSLGAAGAFDDMHIFAPCVAFENGRYFMWYCGSRGKVADRVFALGLATSTDGVHFKKHPASPVYAFGDDRHSVLTPTFLRQPDGLVCREDGCFRMWFSSTDFPSANGFHTLHEATSRDGLAWTQPSTAQLEDIYAPTIIKEGDIYHMWYTDVAAEPWSIRYARSVDGRNWKVTEQSVLQLDQDWENQRLFYPTVLKADGMYMMWYGSYDGPSKTALGFAISPDGIHWQKNPTNPVFGPDESRHWESHYTTSQSVIRLSNGAWRIWYASRTKPPFSHKYFAIGTATWTGPG
ncbi:MAG: hypothetical protein O7E52_21110 [Candidatus Poribacteria bacterium]|nr:hypothetical protein [Candidatus Poribacteria bacterium]